MVDESDDAVSEHEEHDEEDVDEDSDIDDTTSTDISADLGGLNISVSTDGHETPEETEEMFYRVWDYIKEDAEEMSEALRDRMGGQ